MKKANIAELKNRLSHYLARVKRGETVLVMERSRPVARIVPTALPSRMSTDELEAWLRRLEADGVLRLGARPSSTSAVLKKDFELNLVGNKQPGTAK